MSDEISKEAREFLCQYDDDVVDEMKETWAGLAQQAILTATAPLHSRIKELEEALKTHGKHKPKCNLLNYGYGSCNCGLNALLIQHPPTQEQEKKG